MGKAIRQHYGSERSSVGSCINWRGSRYCVVAVMDQDYPKEVLCKLPYDRQWGYERYIPVHNTDPNTLVAIYHARRFRGNGGSALYEIRHYADGCMTTPKRIAE